jgi:hypothetical protein
METPMGDIKRMIKETDIPQPYISTLKTAHDFTKALYSFEVSLAYI